MYKYLFFISIILFSGLCFNVQASSNPLSYDIVYVRYPAKNPDGNYVTIPQGEHPYKIAPGADLILLHPNGKETILVDCIKCSAMDPVISFDGNTVYYSLIEYPGKGSPSWLYKIHLNRKPFTPIRLTYNDGFDSNFYAGNTTKEHNQASTRNIRDMAPTPLADGRLLFTSNRAGLTALDPGADAVIAGSVQQLYVMDDHEGEAKTKVLANIKKLDFSSLHTVQHPMQLLDGRILFSSWQDAGHKYRYAMTNLFTIHPDGTNLQQFTEPHDHHKMLEHFITQLPNEDVISAYYYPSFDYGFGILMRYPIDPPGPDFLRGNIKQRTSYHNKNRVSYKEFDRKGTQSITPHTTPSDVPAPNKSGKYSMPSVAANNSLLVAYSKGYVNHFDAACKPNRCDHLKSGIYLIPNASTNIIYDPKKLVKIKDQKGHNEIWPRAVLPYKALYGKDKPKIIYSDLPATNSATALIGTSSMYNRESRGSNDPFQSNKQRELHDGNWTIQGADAGVYSNSDIYGVRIISTPAKPYTKPINKYHHKKRWQAISPLLLDKRLDKVVARYGSFHGEKWEILGEFPLIHKNKGLKDKQNNPDTSWVAKIPADTPLLIQAIDKNGMTLNSELTWRALKSGEKRVDCGGCHAHSKPALDFETTASGKGYLLYDVPGVDDLDPRIDNGIWNLSSGSIPILTEQGVTFHDKGVLDVEFTRDVYPILKNKCSDCHNSNKLPPNLKGKPLNLYNALRYTKRKDGKNFVLPQISRYIRSPQARQSLLIWVAYNKRLDGRNNKTRKDDIDYPTNHPQLALTDKEKRTLARWVDLGGPINFPNTEGFGYTDDSQLPVIAVLSSKDTLLNKGDEIKIAFHDVKSGLDWLSLSVEYYPISKPEARRSLFIQKRKDIDRDNVLTIQTSSLIMKPLVEHIIEISISDLSGNKNKITKKIAVF